MFPFFFNAPATTEIYTLSLHDALPISVPIRPERICHELSKHVPDDAIVVVDTGHAGMWMGGMYDLRSPNQSYIRSAGHLGWPSRPGSAPSAGRPSGR